MWIIYTAPAFFGVCLNLFMVTTWAVAGKKTFLGLPVQLKACVFYGIVCGLVDIFPSLVLKNDLPCGACGTEECTGSSFFCVLGRSSQFLLLGILVGLASLTRTLNIAVQGGDKPSKNGTLVLLTIPLVLMVCGYILDSEENMDSNADTIGVLNNARHAFSCSMRLPSMEAEWVLLGIPTVLAGSVIVFHTLQTWRHFRKVHTNAGGNHGEPKSQSIVDSLRNTPRMNPQERRLVQIAFMAAVLLFLNLGLSVALATSIDKWGETSKLALECSLETFSSHDFTVYESENRVKAGNSVCSAETANAFYEVIEEGGCKGGCTYRDDLQDRSFSSIVLLCETASGPLPEGPIERGDFVKKMCDCPCEAFVEVEEPSLVIMQLLFLAQSLALTIVGVNLAFTEATMKSWKTFIQSHRRRGTTDQHSSAHANQHSSGANGSEHGDYGSPKGGARGNYD
jgi:hypothetical protein